MKSALDSGVRASSLACTLNSGCDCVHVLVSAVEVVSRRAGLSEREINRMALAVDELFANIGRHGYRGREGRIEMMASFDGAALRFELRDHAPPLDDPGVWQVREVEDDGAPRAGGLGLRLIRAIMDEVRHERLADGNRWVLVKHLKESTGVMHET